MSKMRIGDNRVERALAVVFSAGTWLGSLLIGVGLILRCADEANDAYAQACLRTVDTGIALFILLPILRVTLMAVAFMRRRDGLICAIATGVLCIIAVAALVGLHAF